MSEYLNVGQFKQSVSGKWWFLKLGYAKKNQKGDLDITLDALPLPNEKGFTNLTVTRRQDRDAAQQPPNDAAQQGPAGDPNDDIRF